MKKPSTSPFLIVLIIIYAAIGLQTQAGAYYFDSVNGDDSNNGQSPQTPWQSLRKAAGIKLKAGDAVRLKRGSRFEGSFRIEAIGTADQPVTIEAFGQGAMPVINAKGFNSGVHLLNCQHVIVKDLEITADGGAIQKGPDPRKRYGVHIQTNDEGGSGGTFNILLQNLFIHDIFPAVASPLGGRNPTSYEGTAIAIHGTATQPATFIRVLNCRIERTGFKAIDIKRASQIQILNNHMKDIGGPAIQPGYVDQLLVRGNTVDGSGSSLDPRMHGRGSGIWPWSCRNVLIEKNTFMHARGKADSCGIHIDFNCNDVIVQYNLSHDNEGGFIEILGNNFNCAYRYNISINDGARVKGQDGAHQEGKVLWTSGYVGKNNKKHGPTNSYIYNNTIYVGPNSRSCFSIAPTTQGLLIANNLFHIMGKTVNVSGDQDKRIDQQISSIPRVRMQNNLYLTASVLPPHLPIGESNILIGDAQFVKPGGVNPKDYTPQNIALIQNKGRLITPLPGDKIGLEIGMTVEHDFLGQPIQGLPDLGAIEIQTSKP